MTNQITPPPELVQQLCDSAALSRSFKNISIGEVDVLLILEAFEAGAAQSAQWGADQELEAVCEWLSGCWWGCDSYERELRAARRPKPPSLKEQALELARPAGIDGAHVTFGPEELALIRRALEALPE